MTKATSATATIISNSPTMEHALALSNVLRIHAKMKTQFAKKTKTTRMGFDAFATMVFAETAKRFATTSTSASTNRTIATVKRAFASIKRAHSTALATLATLAMDTAAVMLTSVQTTKARAPPTRRA